MLNQLEVLQQQSAATQRPTENDVTRHGWELRKEIGDPEALANARASLKDTSTANRLRVPPSGHDPTPLPSRSAVSIEEFQNTADDGLSRRLAGSKLGVEQNERFSAYEADEGDEEGRRNSIPYDFVSDSFAKKAKRIT